MNYKAWVTRVIDGDTLEAWAQLRPSLREKIRIRLYGIDAPEVRGESKELGKLSTAWVRGEIANCDSIMITCHDVDSFGRWVCDVAYMKNGLVADLSLNLLQSGHAVKYTRGVVEDGSIMVIPW